jgi:hypothetical protein
MLEKSFDLPLAIESVPDNEFGLYAFRLNLPNDARLGLTAPDADPKAQVLELSKRIHRLRVAIGENQMTGQVSSSQAPHLSQLFTLTADPVLQTFHLDHLSELIDELGGDLAAVRTAASVVRYAIDLSLPLYVGMTARQSFRERLFQHMNGTTQFSDRLRKIHVTWSDLKFVIRPMNVPRRAVGSAEKLVQSLLKPRVSLA